MEAESVMVTGANRGIGLEFVKQLVKLPKPPRFVFATYRNENSIQDLKDIQEKCKETQVVLIQMDISNCNDIEKAKKVIEEKVGDKGLNLLINNAGVGIDLGFPEITEENMLFHFNTNTVGPVIFLKTMLPLLQKSAARDTSGMKVSRSAVVNISSLMGSITELTDSHSKEWLNVLSYRTSKTALNMAMRVIALTIKGQGILVVNMCPGWLKLSSSQMEIESALITGGNRGIGLEIVRQLVNVEKPPQIIFATYRDKAKVQDLEKIKKETTKTEIVLIKADVNNPKDITAARKVVEDKVKDKGLTLLINNAGVLQELEFEDITEEHLLFHLKTNTIAPILVFKEMLPLLEKAAARKTHAGMSVSRAAVISITSKYASVGAQVDDPDWLRSIGYRISKTALNMAMRIISLKVKDKGILVVCIHPGWLKTDMGKKEAPLEVSEGFLTTDGTPRKSERHCEVLFGESPILRVKRNEIFDEISDDSLLQDVLIVRCKIWFDKPLQTTGQCCARTRFGINRLLFHGTRGDFSSLYPGNRKCVTINYALMQKLMYLVDIYLTRDRKIFLEGTPRKKMPCNSLFELPQQSEKLCVCKFSFLDSAECWIGCGQAAGIWNPFKPWKFPLNISKEKLTVNKEQYLPNDTLTLQCEIIYSTGIEFQNVEKVDDGYGLPRAVQQITSNLKNTDFFNDSQELEVSSSFKDELMSLYNSGDLCDMKLRTNTQTFSTHKLILSARSPVFRAMFTHDMKEKVKDCVDIEDLDSDSVRRMLLFMYTDNLEDMEWENAKSLYFAADKYEILSLKQKCSNFLKYNMCLSNCSDILLLSELHNDPNLKKIAREYILKHDKVVFASEEWAYFMENHLQLAAETMRLRYITK
ncbi:Speckle-type POZ protein B like protein [Argiope bruennichi]|uniref:Speckle-type POZ protein B like protein n=1 Tax=Argiope bruennichi TaxID=94029 RepID=A0A8T0EJJ4_ARGBR|nr:Speckle-type POZ protein B like protein [Argiope bruennichi]